MKLNSARISKNTVIPIRTNIITLKCIFDKYNIFKSQNQGAKAKMLGQINDYKNITINTNANPQAIASAINSYSYDDEF